MEGQPFVLPGGTKRSEQAPKFHLVPREGVRRTAQRFSFGATKYGEWNWTESLTNEWEAFAFSVEAYNHMMDHAMKLGTLLNKNNALAEEDRADDHLGAIGWAQSVLAFVEAKFGKPWHQLLRENPVGPTKLPITPAVKK